MLSWLKKKLFIIVTTVLCLVMISAPVMAAGSIYPDTPASVSPYICCQSRSESADGAIREYYFWEQCLTDDISVVCSGITDTDIKDCVTERIEYRITYMPYGIIYTVVVSVYKRDMVVMRSISKAEYTETSGSVYTDRIVQDTNDPWI